MNWLGKLMALLPMIPYIVAGIEKIHGSAISGASKKDLAMQALGLASNTAETVLPGDAPAVAAASDLVSGAIDGVVATFNAAGLFTKSSSSGPGPSSGSAPAGAPAPGAPAPPGPGEQGEDR